MIGLRRAFMAAAMVVGSMTVAAAQQPSVALQLKSADAESLLATAASEGYVRVIVEFLTPNRPAVLTSDPVALEPVKAEIAAIQDGLIADHLGSAPAGAGGFERLLTRMQVTPMMAVNVTHSELEALAGDERVARVYPDLENRAQLIDSVPLIGMNAAYANGGTGIGRAVAILDTGIQGTHEFFGGGKIIAEACFSTAGAGETSLCPGGGSTQFGAGAAEATILACLNGLTNLCAHGSHVAGIAAGFNTSLSAGEPPNGVARSARIVAIQVFRRLNTAGACAPSAAPCVSSRSSDAVAALDWLFQFGLNFAGGVSLASVNMSLGGGGFTSACDSTSPFTAAINNLRGVGVPTVISAGNDSFVNAVSHPACVSTAIAVASSTKTDGISNFSNISDQVAVFAPGSSILSSVPVNAYAPFNGTSMAAPHVAGAIASIRSACGNIPNTGAGVNTLINAIKDSLISVTDNRPGGLGTTKPRIQVDRAINTACAASFAPPVIAFEPAALLGLALLGYLGFRLRRRAA